MVFMVLLKSINKFDLNHQFNLLALRKQELI